MSFVAELYKKENLEDDGVLSLLSVFEGVRDVGSFSFFGSNEEFEDLREKLSQHGIDVIDGYINTFAKRPDYRALCFAVRNNRQDLKTKIKKFQEKYPASWYDKKIHSPEEEKNWDYSLGDILEYNDCCIKHHQERPDKIAEFREKKEKEMYPLEPVIVNVYDVNMRKRFPLIPMIVCPSCIEYAEDLQRQYEKIVEKYNLRIKELKGNGI